MNELIVNESAPPERAFLVGVKKRGETREWLNETLDELALLADTAGALVVERFIQERTTPEPATYIGKGFVEQLAGFIAEKNIELVLFDDDLTPAQVKNLEEAWKTARVIDRTGLILDIFANRARSREAVVQVELAQLEYLLPRLTGQWVHLERQRGGIGMRGPGETQLETDKRIIREKIGSLKKMLEIIEQQREVRKKNRRNAYRIAIVGYTNAGKSTLLKALTGGEPFIV
ncbi:MAG: GTPase HflX, partial [bacterium]|nr:GTPase HflX [bacterium]